MEAFEGTFFFVSAGLLVVFALGISAMGMRNEKFPGESRVGIALTAITGLLVVTTALGAVAEARHEQKIRRAEVAEKEKELAAEEAVTAGEEAPAEEEPEEPAEEDGGTEVASVDGAEIYESQGCGSCHALQAVNSAGQIGPSLDESLVGQDEEWIREAIVAPNEEIAEGFGEGIMPADYGEQLTEVELDALVAFLAESTSGN